MNEREIQVRRLIENVTQKSLEGATIDDNLAELYGMDSMQRIEIVIAIEKKFSITIPDEAANRIRTIKDLLGLIEVQESIRR